MDWVANAVQFRCFVFDFRLGSFLKKKKSADSLDKVDSPKSGLKSNHCSVREMECVKRLKKLTKFIIKSGSESTSINRNITEGKLTNKTIFVVYLYKYNVLFYIQRSGKLSPTTYEGSFVWTIIVFKWSS